MSDILPYLSLSDISLSTMSSGSICVVTNGRMSFFLVLHDFLNVFYVYWLFYVKESIKFLPEDHSYYIILLYYYYITKNKRSWILNNLLYYFVFKDKQLALKLLLYKIQIPIGQIVTNETLTIFLCCHHLEKWEYVENLDLS